MAATLLLALASVLSPSAAWQGDVQVSARLEPAAPAPGSRAELRVQLDVETGWHVYAPDQDPTAGIPISVRLEGTGLTADGELRSLSEAELHVEELGGERLVYKWLSGRPELSLPVKLAAKPGAYELTVAVRYQACNDRVCNPPAVAKSTVTFTLAAEGSGAASAGEGRASGELSPLVPRDLGGAFGNGGGPGDAPKAVWMAELVPNQVKSGERAELRLTARIVDGWHLYHPDLDPDNGVPVSIRSLSGALVSDEETELRSLDEPIVKTETIAGEELTYLLLEGETELRAPVLVSGEPGPASGGVEVRWQACDDSICLGLETSSLTVPLTILPGGTLVGDGSADAGSTAEPAGPDAAGGQPGETVVWETVGTAGKVLEIFDGYDPNPERFASFLETGIAAYDSGAAGGFGSAPERGSAVQERLSQGFLGFLLFAALAALGSLATPCVFPMIPITVSFFTKRAESGKGSPTGNATAYGLGIVLTFVGLGLGLAAILGASGANQFASHPWVNVALALLFLVFAAALLGFIDIQPPAWLQKKLSSSSGAGQSKGGYGPVMVMAVAFTVTAFTCTVGFVGGVLALAAQSGQWFYAAAGMTVYAVVFAAPFFLLALFPSVLARMPKAGGWMNIVKASMGFIELIFAWKFLSNADMSMQLEILTRPVIILMTFVPLVLWAAYLFGLYRLPHDHEKPVRGPKSIAFGVLVLAFSGYILQGFWSGKPYWGAIEAYFPPPQYGVQFEGEGSATLGPADLIWYESYYEAFLKAQEAGKPLLIDFTGVTCVNCRRMEGNIMPDDRVRPLLEEGFVRAELWVDQGEHAEWNRNWQVDRFNTSQQPQYVILDPRY